MNRIRPLFLSQRDAPLPQPKLDTALVKSRLPNAGLPAAQHDEIVTVLRRATAFYMADKTVDERSATPKQVELFLKRARNAVREFQAVLGQAGDDPATKAIVQRIMVSGDNAPTLLDDLKLGSA